MGRGYLNVRATGGAVASPFEGGLGGSAPLLIRFLGASEKMNKSNFTLLGKLASLIIGIEAANVKSPPCHSPSMENGMLDHKMGEIPRRILPTAILDRSFLK